MKTHLFVSIGIVCLMLGCSSQSRDKAKNTGYRQGEAKTEVSTPPSLEAPPAPDEESNSKGIPPGVAISSSATVEKGKDTSRKFIRTADIKFKAKSVVKTTYQIEDITKAMGGFVETTKLSSREDNTNIIPISEDSSLEVLYYTVYNTMTLRVPNNKLDSTLKAIAPLIDYLDSRNIKAEDVALKLMANKLAQKRVAHHNDRVTKAVDEKGKKVAEITEAEESVTNKQEQADNATLSNMELQDKISYSTINLEIYQRQDVKREVVANNKNIDAYRPSIGHRLGEALRSGWELLVELVVGIAQLWALLIWVIIVIIAVRWWIRRGKTKH